MKDKIHPKYGSVLVSCASCGNTFLTASTRLDGPKKEYHGREYPSLTLEICSQCHPFFSGKQIYVDTAGRVEKFTKRYGTNIVGTAPPPKVKTPPKKQEPPKPAAAAQKKDEPAQAQKSDQGRQGRERRPPGEGRPPRERRQSKAGDRGKPADQAPKPNAGPTQA